MAFSSYGAEPQPRRPEPRDLTSDRPTSEQQEAIKLLGNQNAGDVFAYLKFARSAGDGRQRHTGGHEQEESLSIKQVEAIKTLSGCADQQLRTWLRDTRVFIGFEPFKSTSSSSPSAFRLAATPRRLAVPERSNDSKPSSITPPPSQQIANPLQEPHIYHCTSCKDQRSYKNDYDWKKHEKQHEFTYICMPNGCSEVVGQTLKCVLCAAQGPYEQHATDHNAQECYYSCKRREYLVNHLSKNHGVSDLDRGRTLAKLWLRGSGRKAWSCGFCVSLFFTFQERLKHIEIEHFRRHQSIHEWDITKVIKGLLRQPGIYEAWEAQVTAHHGWDSPEITWQALSVGHLQHKLEMGPSDNQSAESLAKEAYDASTIHGDLCDWGDPPDSIGAPKRGMDKRSASLHTMRQDLHAETLLTHPWIAKPSIQEEQHDFINGSPGRGQAYGNKSAPPQMTLNDEAVTQGSQFPPQFASNLAPTPDPDFTLDFSDPIYGRGESNFDKSGNPDLFWDVGDHVFDDIIEL